MDVHKKHNSLVSVHTGTLMGEAVQLAERIFSTPMLLMGAALQAMPAHLASICI